MPTELIIRFVNVFFEILIWILFIRIMLSWFRPRTTGFVVRTIYSVSEPFLQLGRKILPPTKMGLDFSPIIVFLALSFLQSIIINLLNTWLL